MADVCHGGRLDAAIAKYGGSRANWIDLSTGINPNSYPVPEIVETAWTRLPDEHSEHGLLAAAKAYYGVPEHACTVAANGTQALIEILPSVLNCKDVAIVLPTYGEHSHVWKREGAHVLAVAEIAEIPDGIDAAVIVNPNNPDCRVHQPEALQKLAGSVGTLIVDEAFCDTMPEKSIVPTLPENVVVLKSFGKFFGLAGLRLGFAIASAELAAKIRVRIGPWAVSGPALQIGKQALSERTWIEEARNSLKSSSGQLAELLNDAGMLVAGINPLFVHAKHEKAYSLHEHLARNHILVRAFEDRPEYLRFGLCKDKDEMDRLGKSLKAFTGV